MKTGSVLFFLTTSSHQDFVSRLFQVSTRPYAPWIKFFVMTPQIYSSGTVYFQVLDCVGNCILRSEYFEFPFLYRSLQFCCSSCFFLLILSVWCNWFSCFMDIKGNYFQVLWYHTLKKQKCQHIHTSVDSSGKTERKTESLLFSCLLEKRTIK